MTHWAQAALGCGAVVAALLIRTALGEIRRPARTGTNGSEAEDEALFPRSYGEATRSSL